MASVESVQVRASSRPSYERMLQKAMAVACFLFPLLYLISMVYALTGTSEFNPDAVQWIGSNDVEQYRYSAWAWFAMIPAVVGITRLLQAKSPRLAFWGAVFAYLGGLHQASGDLVEKRHAQLRGLGIDVAWNTGGIAISPLDFIGLAILLWMIAMIMLGIASWRTGILPKWVGALIALGAFSFFVYQGPGGIIPALPPVAYLVAGICYILAFPVVGLKLWREQPDPS